MDQHFKKLEILMVSALDQAKPYISGTVCDDVKSFVDHGEYGVGWELLWFAIQSEKVTPSADLIECGKRMGFETAKP